MVTTRSRATKLVFVWVAVTVLLFLSACNNKKSVAPPPPPVVQEPVDPIEEGDFPDGEPELEVGDLPENEKEPDLVISDIEDEVADLPAADPRDLVYSGASTDHLAAQIQAIVNSERDEDAEQANRQFARNIESAFVSISRNHNVKLKLRMGREGGRAALLELGGRLDRHLRFRAGSLRRPPFVMAEGVCMDLNGGCHTIHVRLREGEGPSVRVAHVIVRDTSANMHVAGGAIGRAQNPHYDRLVESLVNTAVAPGLPTSVHRLHLQTSEVINGRQSRSAFKIDMTLGVSDPYFFPAAYQHLGWEGPLFQAKNPNDIIGMPIDPLEQRFTDRHGRRIEPAGLVADTIRETRLLRNNGAGRLQIEIAVAALTPGAREDRVRLTVSRKHKPVRAPVLL